MSPVSNTVDQLGSYKEDSRMAEDPDASLISNEILMFETLEVDVLDDYESESGGSDGCISHDDGKREEFRKYDIF